VSNNPPGVRPDQLAVVARRVLLDGLDALRPHIDAITVIGAQAVYLRTPHAPIASAAYTSDGDLGVDPVLLGDKPLIDEALRDAGFRLRTDSQPGIWSRSEIIDGRSVDVGLDILVGASVVDGGRAARIPPHDKMSAKKVPGIEAALVDRSPLLVGGLDSVDTRRIAVNVAGAAALLVAKAFKINDRLGDAVRRPDRLTDKDAGDVLRIMMATPVVGVAASFAELVVDQRVGDIATTGLALLRDLFGGADTPGVRMATAALRGDVPEERIRALAPAFIRRLP
jgi:hypothetical protein